MQTIYLKSPMKEEFKKYIKKEEYNPDINKTEIWIGNFSDTPTINPIIIILEIISHFQNQDYKIIVDDYLEYNNGKYWQKTLIFRDITFNESVKFYYISFKDCVCFEKCIFKKEVSFSKCAFNEKVDFINCIFKERTNFRGAFFCSISDFSDTVFEGEQNNFSFIHSFEDFYCENINLKSSINFSYSDFKKTVSFERAVFEGEADFSNVEFGEYIRNDLEYSEYAYAFKKYIEETAIQLKGLLENTSKFIEIKNDENDENSFFSIIFNDAVFSENAIFRESVFENMANFTNTKFEKLVDFHLVEFNKAQQFYSTTFLDRAIFSNTIFHGEAQFLYCLTDSNSYIGFESAIFKKGLDISRSNFNNRANFWNIELEEKDIFTSSKYQNDFKEEAELKTTKNTPTIYKKIRETYRIIKSNFYSQNNKIEGLKFYEKEMSVYLEEKRAEDKKLNSTNKFTLRNLNLENEIDSFFTNKSAIIKKKLTSFCSFFICFLQNILLPSYELFPFIEFFKSILSQFKKTFKDVFSFLYKPFYIILYIIVISFKEFRNRNITLYRSSFCIMILFFFLAYMISKEYCWFWAFVIISTLVVLTEFYDRRKDTRKLIRSNNYIPFVLITFALIWSFIVFYGYGNYKQDFFYLLINKTYYSLKIIIKDIDMLVIGSYGIIILSFIFLVVFRRQDKIILWLNKNSNEFETNWVVGVNFSMLVGCLTYFTILLSINSNIVFDESTEGISNFLTSLVDVFNITKWDNLEIIGVKLKGFSYLLLFIGRIFIGYGYYQTIQAFRKFGKS